MTETADHWRFRCACCASHIARRYGAVGVDETHGGYAEHYGWPKRSVGIEWSWGRNTWFCGWELRKQKGG
jgi:hypothetical protein